MRASFIFLCVPVVACGSELPDGSSAGDGNSVLEVSGDVEATNQIPNATSANDFNTSFEVRVQRNGIDVADAVVNILTDAGAVELRLNNDGEYVGAQPGYTEVYRLDIDAGPDFVHGVRVDGPDIHSFITPTLGATVDGNADLLIEWSRDETAEIVTIEAREMDELSISDTGSFTAPLDALEWDGESFDERIRLERANRVSPIGAAGDSSFVVSVRNEIEFLAVP